MDEQRAWLRARRKKRLRITAVILIVCLLVTTYPDILTTISALAADIRSVAGTVTITGFAALPEDTASQTVPVGTALDELDLPDALEAYAAIEETVDGGEPGADDGTGEENPGADDDAEEENPGADDDAEEENPGTDDGAGEESPGTDDGAEEENPGADDGMGGENPGADDGTAEETSGTDDGAAEENPGTETGGSDDGADAAASPTIETGSFTLPEYQSENPAGGIAVQTLATETIEITDVTWEASPAYDSGTEGLYIFTPVLPDGYALADGVTLPEITVTVAADDTQAEELRALLKLLRALPDPEEYLTYDEAEDLITAHEDIIDEEQMKEARGAADDYLDKYPDAADATAAADDSATADADATAADDTAEADAADASDTLSMLLKRLTGLEHIRDTEANCVDLDCPYHYPQFVLARMNAYEEPVLLTLEDLVEDYGMEEPVQTYSASGSSSKAARAAAVTHPGTYVTTEDNENNAGTGTADGDLDKYLFVDASEHPIEANIVIPEGELPTQSCYIAVRTYDVNWQGRDSKESAEYDKLFVNGVRIGTLTGLDDDWNTSYYQVPLYCLKEGKNTVKIEIWNCIDKAQFWDDDPSLDDRKSWAVSIDWMQLVCDGGSRDGIEEFSISLSSAAAEGEQVAVQAETVIKSTDTSAQYDTEYSITDSKGYIVGSYQEAGVSGGTHTFTITMPEDSKDGTYTLQGLLKRQSDGAILAVDAIDFSFVSGETLFGLMITPTLTPATLTNQNVTVTLEAAAAEGVTDINISPASGTATANGVYNFTVTYKENGVTKSITYPVTVNNIDKVAPVITYEPITIREEQSLEEVEALFAEALSVTDDRKLAEEPLQYTIPADISATPGTKNVTVTAVDYAGNTATKSCAITIQPVPIKLTIGEPQAVTGSKDSCTLNAVLENTGGGTITETGFVWGVIADPTLEVSSGSVKTSSVVKTKGGKLSANATGLVYGMEYYARAYAKVTADGKTSVAYSDSRKFGIGIPFYGTFSVSGVSGSTFTITRTDGTDGQQTVYYRTVNGSAIGGTHFTHAAGSVTFADGETKKTVTVTEKSVTTAYNSNTATRYSNADRTYSFEIYRVEGGGEIDQDNRSVTRTMEKSSSYTIDRTIYTTEKSKIEVTGTTGRNGKRIADTKSSQGGAQTNVSFLTNRYGETNYNTSSTFSTYYTNANQRTYLNATADGWYYRYMLMAYEYVDGYEYAYFGTKPLEDKNYDLDGKSKGAAISGIAGQLWMCNFMQGALSAVGSYNFPDTRTGGGENSYKPYKSSGTTYSYNGDTYVRLGFDDTCYLYFGATGADSDVWYVDGLTGYALVYDETEPTCIGVAPMAGGAYLPGDSITVALVFDEIVDSANSDLTSVAINTNVGTLTYAGGADTNVLYFTGTVSSAVSLSGSSALTVSSITNSGNIRDMCSLAGTASTFTSSNTNIEVDATTPTVTITAKTSGSLPSHQALVTATGAASIQYVWTQDTAMPAYGWQDVTSGTTLTGNYGTAGTTETWYLHVKATASSGASTYEYKAFSFKQPAITAVSVRAGSSATSTDVSDVWKTSKYIVVQYAGTQTSGTTLTFDGPQTSTQSITAASGTKYLQVTENGTYTITLTDSYGNVLSERVEVKKIDAEKPTVTIQSGGSTSTDVVYNTVTTLVIPKDTGGSGVAKVEYAWTNTTSTPSTWSTLSAEADGSYPAAYEATETTKTTKYLHVRVTDGAGNVSAVVRSGPYQVIAPATGDALPTITVTGNPTDWTKSATLSWTATAGTGTGAGAIKAVYVPGSEALTDTTGTVDVTKNGNYMFMVVDDNGNTVTEEVVVTKIDNEAPTVSALTVSPEGYAPSKTVTLTGVTDDLTTLYDEKGVTGKGGSGVVKMEYQREGDSAWTTVNASGATASFTVSDQGTYKVKLIDKVGNESKEYTINVEEIDKTAPTLTAEVNATLKTSGWYTDSTVPVTLTFSDEAGAEGPASGVKSVEYAFTMTKTTPASLTSLGSTAVAGGSAVCSLTSNGTYYLYCKVTDQAGNETAGWMKADGSIGSESGDAVPIKKDSNKGSGTISGPAESQPASSGLTMSISVSYGPSGGELTATGQVNPIGTLAAHDGPGTANATASYTTKTVGTNYIYIRPTSWGSRYFWSYYVRKVSFDSQGGSAVEDQLVWTKQAATSTSTSVDCELTKPADPERTGYTFDGWYTDAACTQAFDFENQTQIRTDTTLYAKWTAVTYNVTYELKVPQPFTSTTYSEADYEAPADKTTYLYGDEMELPVPELPENVSGFVFDGWYTKADYSGARYTSVPKTAAADITYYGRFRDVEAPRCVSYTTPGGSNLLSGIRWYNNSRTGQYIYFNYRDNTGIKSYSVLWDGNKIEIPKDADNIISSISGNYLNQRVYVANNNYEGFQIQTGEHTYTAQVWDEAGNMGEYSITLRYDPDAPTIGDMTYSVTPDICGVNDRTLVAAGTDGSRELKIFSEAPTFSFPVSDATSGLWKLTYVKTPLDSYGNVSETETAETVTVDLTALGSAGVAKITLTDEGWHGTITDIILYDNAGNAATAEDIGEIMVDTTPPVIRETTNGQIYLGNDISSGNEGYYREAVEGKWYTSAYLTDKGITRIYGSILDGVALKSYRWLVNGKEIKTDNYSLFNTSQYAVYLVNLASYTGINVFTLEVTDYAGHVTTASVTVKIGDSGSAITEQTPAAACDYPADAIGQLAANTDYQLEITSGTNQGKKGTVKTDADGHIPFVTMIGSTTVDLCGQTVSIVKKGTSETVDGVIYTTTESDAQSLTINARPDALADNKAEVMPELLQEADDAQINMTIDGGDSYTWEYSADNGQSWKDVPDNNTITNLPTGGILLRAKAKANTSDSANDGNPHGKQSTKTIAAGTGTITVQYDWNRGSGSADTYAEEKEKTYKNTLTKPSDPVRDGYEFMGWYVNKDDYVPGGSTDQAWRFAGAADAQIVGEILGDDRDKYTEHCTIIDGVYVVTLYAGWRENVAPTLNATLTDNSSGGANGSSGTVINDSNWHNSLAIDLTFSDNVGVTKLSVQKDSAAYVELSGNGIGTSAGAGTTYKLTYPAMKEGASIEEGAHTYTFLAQDAAGNETTVQVTAKLDTTAPVFGEAAFETGYKNLWNWIIRKESLTITIPITETGSGIGGTGATGSVTYKLIEDGTASTGGEWKTAAVSGSTAGYTATITVNADFKGEIVVQATDNAGNVSGEMHIGPDADGDLKGVIVEAGAPQISVKADRSTSDAAATVTDASNGVALDNDSYYNSAPRLFVTVTDEKDANGESALTAGLASIEWTIAGSGTYNPVQADYLGTGTDRDQPLTSHSFTIGGLEGQTGEVKVTVTAIDNAGNETKETITLHIKDKMAIPSPSVDYINEKLTGLTAGAKYSIDGEEVSAEEDGSIAIKEAWFGSDLSIHGKTDNDATTLDSDDVQITLNARPEAPAITKTDETIKGKQDGKIHHLDTTMEYSTDGGTTWIAVQTDDLAGDVMENLPAGEILVRVKAKANSTDANDGAPHGQHILAQIEEGTPLTVTFDTNGGSDITPVTGLAWNDTINRPDDPVKDGYAVEGWYREETLDNKWNFASADAETTSGAGTTADQLNDTTGVDVTADPPGITLYAKWKDDEAPSLDAALVAGDSRTAADESGWYQNPAIVLTYSDNEAVTKLYVKKDDETTYTEITGYTDTAAENGTDAAGNKRFQYAYTTLAEGQHTYTFKAEDAEGMSAETTLMAKRDTTAPAFGSASYEEGYKNLWNWIIRKESLIITIPVTEEGSGLDTVEYTLISAADTADGSADDGTGDTTGGTDDSTGNTVTGTATIKEASGGETADYIVTIAISPDFKGKVKVTGYDNAGNAAAEKTIGADGNGVGGVIVEDNAPQITILADRYPSENAATQTGGTQLRDEKYSGAPGLVVIVTDDEMDDGAVIASGLAKVTWEVADTAEKGERTGTDADGALVGTAYDAQMITSDIFTIPDTALQAAEQQGKSWITVTVTATDQAGNTAVKTVYINLKSKENTPNAEIGYVAETLTGLKANTAYVINDMGVLSSAGGTAEITESWFGTEKNTIVLPGDGELTMDSLPQTLDIPARPDAPVAAAGNASYPGAADGTITVTDSVNGVVYEFSADGGVTWETVSGAQITGLAAGTYQIRQKAVEGKNFKSLSAEVDVEEDPASPYAVPEAEIDYEKELLTAIAPDAVYEISYDVPEHDETDTAADSEGDSENSGDNARADSENGGDNAATDSDEDEYEGITETFTAAADGTLPVKEEWLVQKLHIIRMGNGREWCASDTQQLDIPDRPAAPENLTGISITRENVDPDKLAQIKGLTAGTTYEVSTDGGKTWLAEKKTADADGTISGLDAPQSYIVRVAASNAKKNFAGYPSETAVSVDNFKVTVTFMVEDETAGGADSAGAGSGSTTSADSYKVYQTAEVYYGWLLDTVPAVPTRTAADGSLLVGEWCKDKEGNTPIDLYTEKITDDMTVYAANYAMGYTVTLTGGTGYTLTAQRGSVSPVKSGGSFTFVFKLSEGYEKTENFAVKVNGVAVTLDEGENGETYTITDVTENQIVTVEGVQKTPEDPDNPDKPNKPNKPGGGGSGDESGGEAGDDASGGGQTDDNSEGGGQPTDSTPPTDDNPPADDQTDDNFEGGNDGGDKKSGDADDKKPGDADDKKPGDSDDKTPDDTDDKEQGVKETIVPSIIEDGKIVIPGGTLDGMTENGTDGQTDGAAGDYALMTDAASGVTTARIIFQQYDENGNPAGAVIVTVVCEEQKWRAGVKDALAVANAVLTKEQMQLVQSGENIEIKIDVKDISGSVPQKDKEIIENCIEAYKDEIPGLVLGMYIDISMYIKIGDGNWNAVTKTGEPVDVVIGIPEELRADGRVYYIIRAHEGECTFMEDTDDAPENITISTDSFSSYAIAYQQTDGADGDGKCGLCHICPTFLGVCYFIWLAVIIAMILIIWIVIRRKRREQEEPKRHA